MGNFKAFSPALQKVLNQIESEVGKEIIINVNEASTDFPLQASWGSITMDIAGGGGTPSGRLVKIVGLEGTGKTTIAIHACVQVQKRQGIAAIIDVENSLNYGYCQQLGLDLSKVIVVQPDSGEQALNCVERLIESDEVDIVVLDSIAMLVPEAELEGEAGEFKVALQARHNNQHLRKVIPNLRRTGCTYIAINQFREKVGIVYGSPLVEPGGNGWKFAASQCLTVKREEKVGDSESGFTGNNICVEFTKNKLHPPFKKAYFTIVYGKGISRESEIINACLDINLLQKTGSGPAPNFITPIWSGAIASTEANTIIALGTPEFADLAFEMELRLDLYLKKITEEEFNAKIQPIYSKYEDSGKLYDEAIRQANIFSGKSLYIQSAYYAKEALTQRPLDKTAKKKFDDMSKKIKEKLYNFSGEIPLEDRTLFITNGEITDVVLKEVTPEIITIPVSESIANIQLQEKIQLDEEQAISNLTDQEVTHLINESSK